MRMLLTGASGFIGAHVCRCLLRAGHDVLALAEPGDNLWRLADMAGHVEIMRGTLNQPRMLRQGLAKWLPEGCIHLAWYAVPGRYLDSQENLSCLRGSLELLQTLCSLGCRRFVGAGTCAEYKPKDELLIETDKTAANTLYAACKLAFGMIGQQIARQGGTAFAWGRIFHLYGPQEDPRRLVAGAILKLQNGQAFLSTPGNQLRDYLHVSDVARAFCALLESNADGVYNIASGHPIRVRDLLGHIGGLVGHRELLQLGALPYRPDDVPFVAGNNERLQETGWHAQISLEAGLRDTIQWWQEAPARPVP